MTVDSTTTLSNTMKTFYTGIFLETLTQEMVLEQFCTKQNIPLNKGKTAEFDRYYVTGPVTDPLTEGSSGTESNMLSQKLTATVEEFGDFYKPTSLFSATTVDSGLEEYMKEVGKQAAESLDLIIAVEQAIHGGFPIRNDNSLTYSGTPSGAGSTTTLVQAGIHGTGGATFDADLLNGGRICITAKDATNYGSAAAIHDWDETTVTFSDSGDYIVGSRAPRAFAAATDTTDDFRVVGTSDIAATDIITGTSLKLAQRALKRNGARPWSGGYFALVIDPEGKYDLMSAAEWLAIGEYQKAQNIEKGEVGMFWGFKVFESTTVFRQAVTDYSYSETGAVHVYPAFGRQSIALATLAGNRAKIIHHTFKEAADPLEMFQTIGWKFVSAARVLNAMFSVNLLCGATA